MFEDGGLDIYRMMSMQKAPSMTTPQAQCAGLAYASWGMRGDKIAC